MDELFNSVKRCQQDKCLSFAEHGDLEKLEDCVKNCTVGVREVQELQTKHAEVTRLTYLKNIERCLSINSGGISRAALRDDSEGVKWSELVQCITHNTDKVDRRFFGYYSNTKMKMVNKYSL